MKRIGVLGAGSWGTALAVHVSRNGYHARLWGRDRELISRLREDRRNDVYLPGVQFPPSLSPTARLDEALDGASYVITAVPSHGLRAVVRDAKAHVGDRTTIVSATKGLEPDSLCRMSQVIHEELGSDRGIAVLSGPSFAIEVARQLPTALSVASADRAVAITVQHELRGPSLRLYATDDVVGVEIGGAMKNVIAIAAGVVDGLRLGHNAMAALITRGLVEMARLASAVGGRRDTLAGLSGLGDLVLTCTGELSRNRSVGVELGRGRSIDDILSGMRMVAEGVRTTHAALALGLRHGVELPIAAEMAAVLLGHAKPLEAVNRLMLRPPKPEH